MLSITSLILRRRVAPSRRTRDVRAAVICQFIHKLSGETIFDAEPGAIAVPVLVVGNEYDTCPDTPPGDAPMVLAALTRSPRKELVMVTSGQTAKGSDPCQGMSPHGYLGIEGTVVQRISE